MKAKSLVATLLLSLGVAAAWYWLARETGLVTVIQSYQKQFALETGYCPARETFEAVEAEPQAGCELILRAFKLGYTTNLGTCGEKSRTKKLELCTNRQLDEPWLHYSYRRLLDFYDQSTKGWLNEAYWKKTYAIFRVRFQRLRELTDRTAQIVQGVQRASHHIFTNLPKPADDNAMAAYRLDENHNSTSELFNDVYGYMLFSRKYPDAAGIDTEYTIHWESPADSCERLAGDSAAFLKSYGLTRSIQHIFDRLKEQRELSMMQMELKTLITGLPPPLPPPADRLGISLGKKLRVNPQPQSVVSFQCFIEDPSLKQPETKTLPFQILGQGFEANAFHFPPVGKMNSEKIDMGKFVAKTLVPGFQYLGRPDPRSEQLALAALFGDGDFVLTRLEHLKHSDVFEGEQWLKDRPDLLQVYPYAYHLEHFVRTFREDYHVKRTRL